MTSEEWHPFGLRRQAQQQWVLVALTVLPRLFLFARDLLHRYGPDSGRMVYDGYLLIAQSLVRSGVYGFDGVHSITTRSPLLPLLLIPGVAFGQSVAWTFLLQSVLTIGAVINVHRASRCFGASQAASFLAAAFLALNPWLMLAARYPNTAIAGVFLISCLLRFLSREQYTLLGLSEGLLAVCHPSCSFALAGALAADGFRRGWHGVARRAIAALGVYLLILSPWLIRNYALTGRIIPGVDGFGYQFLIGSSVLKFGKPVGASLQPLVPAGHTKFLFGTMDSVANSALDRIAREQLFDTVVHHPGRFLYRFTHQFVYFWLADRDLPGMPLSVAHFLYLLPLWIGAGFAIWFRWRSAGALILISVPAIVIHSVVTSLAFEAMYSLPVIPVLAVMTACAGDGLFRSYRERQAWKGMVRPAAMKPVTYPEGALDARR